MYIPFNEVTPAEASVEGDTLKWAQYSPIWRTALEAVHGLLTGPSIADATDLQPEEDVLVGRFAYLDLPKWGGCVYFHLAFTSGLR